RRRPPRDLAGDAGEGVPPQRGDRDAPDAAAWLAPPRAARARRRRAGLGLALRLRPAHGAQRARAAGARQRSVLLPPEARIASRGTALGGRVLARRRGA